MNKKVAIDYFGSAAKLAKALGVSRSAVSQWDDTIPLLRAYQIEKITNGRLFVGPASVSSSGND